MFSCYWGLGFWVCFVGFFFLFGWVFYWSIEARMANKYKYFSTPLGVALSFKLDIKDIYFVGKNFHNAEKGKDRLQVHVMKEKKTENPYIL